MVEGGGGGDVWALSGCESGGFLGAKASGMGEGGEGGVSTGGMLLCRNIEVCCAELRVLFCGGTGLVLSGMLCTGRLERVVQYVLLRQLPSYSTIYHTCTINFLPGLVDRLLEQAVFL